jgi:tRNA(fMet)-specific endonuclease VapC
MKCLDTDFLVAILRGNPEAEVEMRELDEMGRQATTAVNAFEIFYGAYKSRRREVNVQESRRLLAKLMVLPLDQESAEKAGQAFADLESRGAPVEFRDVLVAGISMRNRLALVTRNEEHYSRIDQLKIEKW